jgi:hypothetical protein
MIPPRPWERGSGGEVGAPRERTFLALQGSGGEVFFQERGQDGEGLNSKRGDKGKVNGFEQVSRS